MTSTELDNATTELREAAIAYYGARERLRDMKKLVEAQDLALMAAESAMNEAQKRVLAAATVGVKK